MIFLISFAKILIRLFGKSQKYRRFHVHDPGRSSIAKHLKPEIFHKFISFYWMFWGKQIFIMVVVLENHFKLNYLQWVEAWPNYSSIPAGIGGYLPVLENKNIEEK